MKKRLFYVLLFTISILQAQQKQDSIKANELDEVVISDSKFKLKRENSGKTIIKITADELERNRGKTVAEIINSKSGIEINGSRSNAGQNLGYFVRGGNNRQVLVIIDGVQVSDPSQIANDYDLRLIDVGQIESIEIIKGASSTLYGNNAATAVINITSKKANKKSISAAFSTAIGSNQSSEDDNYNVADFTNTASVSGTLKKVTYLTSFLHQYSDGLSATILDNERDAFNRINVNTNIGYQISDKFNIGIYANHTKLKFGFDDTFFLDDAFTKSEQNRVGASLKYKYKQGNFTINTSYNSIFRDVTASFSNKFEGKSFVVDAFNKYKFKKNIYTVVGVNFIENRANFDQEQKTNIIDPYANVVWVSDFGLNLNIGARLNNHSEYGTHLIYNFNPSFTKKMVNNSYVKLLGSYATSYIAPSLYQLYGDGGFVLPSLNLKPEENTTIEVGFEINLNNKTTFSTVFFKRNEENVKRYETVDFVTFQGQYMDTNENVEVNGFEVEITSYLLEKLNISANYTFIERKDVVTLRIPKHKVNVSLNYDLNDKTTIGLNYQYVDDRLDVFFNSTTFVQEFVNLKSFSLVGLNFQREIIKNRLKAHVSLTNLFNEDYTEIIGFTTEGRNAKIGLNLRF